MRFAVVGLVLGALAGAGRAHAESPEQQVERLAAEAVNAYKGADYKRAVELLQRAYDIRQVPALLYNMAKAYDKLGDIDHAYDSYRQYANSAAADPKLKARAEARLALLTEEKRQKAAEQRAVETPPPVVEKPPPVVEAPRPPEPTPEERQARAHDDYLRDRHRARVTTIVLGGATAAFAAVALGLSVDALGKEHLFAGTTDPDAKARYKSDAVVRGAVADGFWCAAAVGAAVTGYYLYRSFRHERPPSVAFAPLVAPSAGGLAAAGRF